MICLDREIGFLHADVSQLGRVVCFQPLGLQESCVLIHEIMNIHAFVTLFIDCVYILPFLQ